MAMVVSLWGVCLFFVRGSDFPLFSDLGCFTLAYLSLFSLVPVFAMVSSISPFAIAISSHCKLHPHNSLFVASFFVIGVPLFSVSLFCLGLPESQLTGNRAVTLLIIFNTANVILSIVLTGIEQKWIREHGFASYSRLALLFLMHLLVSSSNPLVPLFSLLDFISRLVNSNLFSVSPVYVSCVSSLVFLQVCFGLAWPVWHNIVVIRRLKNSSITIADQLKFQSVSYSAEEMIQFCVVLALCLSNQPLNSEQASSLSDQLILSVLGLYMLLSVYFSAFCFCDNCSTGCTRKLMKVVTFCFYFQYLSYSLAFLIQLPSSLSFRDDSRLFGIGVVLVTCLMVSHLVVDAPRVLYNTVYLIPLYIDEVTGFPRDEEELDALLVQEGDIIF